MIYARTHNAQYNNVIQAFDSIADYRTAESEGWRLERITRRETEREIGSRLLNTSQLDCEGCGYRVSAED